MATKLTKYIQSCQFKQLKLVPAEHSCVSPAGVKEIAEAVEQRQGEPRGQKTVQGAGRLFHPDGPQHQIPEQLFAVEPTLGDRGVYIHSEGLVPPGTKGTVVGVYSAPTATQLELLLDSCYFGGSDLCGRTPSMRGLLIPSSHFLRLPQQALQKAVEPIAPSNKISAKAQVKPQGDKPNGGKARIVVAKRSSADGGRATVQTESPAISYYPSVQGASRTNVLADWDGTFKQLFQLEGRR
mmetsp:Transcript_3919/g.8482  ORF Transcript_3919/g.8482 Transcript_3919/m.8482 type:complete len:239 (+) Transcript_3919:2-718(+)